MTPSEIVDHALIFSAPDGKEEERAQAVMILRELLRVMLSEGWVMRIDTWPFPHTRAYTHEDHDAALIEIFKHVEVKLEFAARTVPRLTSRLDVRPVDGAHVLQSWPAGLADVLAPVLALRNKFLRAWS